LRIRAVEDQFDSLDGIEVPYPRPRTHRNGEADILPVGFSPHPSWI
jgi:hypothetical protein